MIQYSADGKYAAYCGYRFRKDPKSGYFLCSTKTEIGKRERLHCFVYRKSHNLDSIPDGFQVHHKDADKNNNEPSNLVLLSASDHQKEHGSMLTDEQRQWRRDNIISKANPAAKEWHKSSAGHEWHAKHGVETMNKRALQNCKCVNCGASFETKRIFREDENKFCCNACKSAYRRKAGVDDVERVCAVCGKKFSTNKFRPRQTCSLDCGQKYRKMRNSGCV